MELACKQNERKERDERKKRKEETKETKGSRGGSGAAGARRERAPAVARTDAGAGPVPGGPQWQGCKKG